MTDPPLFGARIPALYGMTAGHGFYTAEQQIGRPVLLVLAGGAALGRLPALLAEVAARWPMAEAGLVVVVVVDDNPALVPVSVPVVDGGRFLGECGVGPSDIMLLLLDRALRVAAQAWPERDAEAVPLCLRALAALPREAPGAVFMPAPAIVLPNLLSPETCRALIALFETSPTLEGEIARIGADGAARSVVDHDRKRRRDMPVAPGSPLHDTLRAQLLARCAPEIARAFQARISETDRILVARYDDSGGWFRRHRDNDAPNVAFREFALSVNLNAEDFEGGDLLFPEYNDRAHRPPTGAGLIFSASVLHEAAPVTRGRRYVLLTFFYSALQAAVPACSRAGAARS